MTGCAFSWTGSAKPYFWGWYRQEAAQGNSRYYMTYFWLFVEFLMS